MQLLNRYLPRKNEIYEPRLSATKSSSMNANTAAMCDDFVMCCLPANGIILEKAYPPKRIKNVALMKSGIAHA